jgi:hypothetical protein
MSHCDNCGAPVTLPPGPSWEHDPHPPDLDPVFCVLGITNGAPYTVEDFETPPDDPAGGIAVPCTDPGCDAEGKPPWWAEEDIHEVPDGSSRRDPPHD